MLLPWRKILQTDLQSYTPSRDQARKVDLQHVQPGGQLHRLPRVPRPPDEGPRLQERQNHRLRPPEGEGEMQHLTFLQVVRIFI